MRLCGQSAHPCRAGGRAGDLSTVAYHERRCLRNRQLWPQRLKIAAAKGAGRALKYKERQRPGVGPRLSFHYTCRIHTDAGRRSRTVRRNRRPQKTDSKRAGYRISHARHWMPAKRPRLPGSGAGCTQLGAAQQTEGRHTGWTDNQRSTTTVSSTRSLSPVLAILCTEPFGHMWHTPAASSSSRPSHTALPVPERT
ncbi:Uncharacterised protein [Anaerotruncus sp. 2789STDY5834896]|uniref:Uncharacterized protein n=1 Tax=uncultured Anaerotruncus sp. TaxID=905011 RepID=A0A1C6HRM7_9FIRM|nr:Uncharacterised protein [uncultured Anaerotruncus sp.]